MAFTPQSMFDRGVTNTGFRPQRPGIDAGGGRVPGAPGNRPGGPPTPPAGGGAAAPSAAQPQGKYRDWRGQGGGRWRRKTPGQRRDEAAAGGGGNQFVNAPSPTNNMPTGSFDMNAPSPGQAGQRPVMTKPGGGGVGDVVNQNPDGTLGGIQAPPNRSGTYSPYQPQQLGGPRRYTGAMGVTGEMGGMQPETRFGFPVGGNREWGAQLGGFPGGGNPGMPTMTRDWYAQLGGGGGGGPQLGGVMPQGQGSPFPGGMQAGGYGQPSPYGQQQGMAGMMNPRQLMYR